VYAAVSLVPVLVLGVVLAATYRVEARRRGVAEGRAEAGLVAHSAIEPLLDGRPLAAGVSDIEQGRLWGLLANSPTGTILRLRLRDLEGRVVFSGDGSGFHDKPDDEAVEAGKGGPVTRLTRLNADGNDDGPRGVAAVEAYQALTVGGGRVGVLEVYLPYAPIQADVAAGLDHLYRDLALGLALLYLVLFGISLSVSRGLRKQLALNAFIALHDSLTELPNRTQFLRQAGDAVAASSPEQPAAIAIIDLDRFKEVNDSLGHHNGDRLLTELARRLAAAMPPGATVARLGGDEYGIVLPGAVDAAAALARLRDEIGREIEVSGLPVSVEASVGYALAPADGTNVDDLLQQADVAMYTAKAEHTGVVRYDPSQVRYDAGNLGLIAELRHAIDAGQLVLHYQPKLALADGGVEAVEALVRWQHPALGLLAPDRFLPLAEQTDLIDRLTDWVLDRAIADVAALRSDLAVAVNVSARSLACVDFARRVVAVLRAHRLAPERLIIEITETALLANPDRAATILAALGAEGVRVSIDDFGQGHTSLGYLSALTVHELKIDKSFVLSMLENAAHAAIVRSIVDLGHNLSLRVVGEGVETEAILDVLRRTGCDVAQGYFFARPMPVADLRGWLADWPQKWCGNRDQSGGRFSRNASLPSSASSVM
jgi:diguanylate cyclase (GGDEF)-like protein